MHYLRWMRDENRKLTTPVPKKEKTRESAGAKEMKLLRLGNIWTVLQRLCLRGKKIPL